MRRSIASNFTYNQCSLCKKCGVGSKPPKDIYIYLHLELANIKNIKKTGCYNDHGMNISTSYINIDYT